MKKIIFLILSLGVLFTGTANADGHCKGWEHGTTGEIINDPNILGYFPTALEPYCWQVSDLDGYFYYNSQWYDIDPLEVQGLNDSYFNYYALEKSYSFGELYYGVFVYVEVYGFPHDVPKVTMDYLPGTKIDEQNIYSPSGDIVNGTRYKFFMPFIEVSQAQTYGDINIYSTVRIYDGLTLKREFLIK